MVQGLGLEYAGTIWTMAHWDSKKDLIGRAQRGWHDICSLSTHFSAALPKPQAGIRFPPYLYHGSLTKLCKKWAIAGTWNKASVLFPTHFTHYWALRRTVGTSQNCSEVFRALPLQSMETW